MVVSQFSVKTLAHKIQAEAVATPSREIALSPIEAPKITSWKSTS